MRKKKILTSLLGVALALALVVGAGIRLCGENPQPEFLQIETTFLG
ncbi:hypothetical protein SAMN05444401_0166 [Clostridium amylolyticum]|uniref:Uncharacterized protein n=1 Tax=Clostridium amylolyticum TaxID=1121298 RepID=A0A1M6NDD1_9CLOT|nr:hypothetical protein [Clostridium amylolyticum]SHJ93653.1 hypothetical protein SAMN05444401_0166 [Clostridium amylolyticum]